MLIEIRKLKKRSTQQVIRSLQYRGRLPVHINEKGYVCYDSAEFDKYKKTRKMGRPLKNKGEN